MKYIIKNCDNCYCYDDEENIKDKYWCEFQRDNTHFANPCYKSDCLLKQIVEKCKTVDCGLLINDKRCGAIDDMQICCELQKNKKILDLLEIEECEDEN